MKKRFCVFIGAFLLSVLSLDAREGKRVVDRDKTVTTDDYTILGCGPEWTATPVTITFEAPLAEISGSCFGGCHPQPVCDGCAASCTPHYMEVSWETVSKTMSSVAQQVSQSYGVSVAPTQSLPVTVNAASTDTANLNVTRSFDISAAAVLPVGIKDHAACCQLFRPAKGTATMVVTIFGDLIEEKGYLLGFITLYHTSKYVYRSAIPGIKVVNTCGVSVCAKGECVRPRPGTASASGVGGPGYPPLPLLDRGGPAIAQEKAPPDRTHRPRTRPKTRR